MKNYLFGLFIFLLLVPSVVQADLFFGIGFGYRSNYPVYRQHYQYDYHRYDYSPRIINNYYPKSYDNYRHIPQHQHHVPQQNGPTIINNYYR